jgi:hypothetical protein
VRGEDDRAARARTPDDVPREPAAAQHACGHACMRRAGLREHACAGQASVRCFPHACATRASMSRFLPCKRRPGCSEPPPLPPKPAFNVLPGLGGLHVLCVSRLQCASAACFFRAAGKGGRGHAARGRENQWGCAKKGM